MTFDVNLFDIMKEIGCGDGFHIPVANEENRLLEKEIKELIQKKAGLLVTEELLDNELREQKNILNNLSNYEAQNQKLIIANRKQNETEQHMLGIANKENERLTIENRLAAKSLNELIAKHDKLNNELTKSENHIKKLRETIEWGEETLLAWNNDLCKRNTDVNILEAYHLEDNIRFKELDLRRQHLQRDVIERESIVEKEVSELLQVERELEQTSKLNREAQHERNQLLEQWENATNFLNSNQKETQNIIEEINKIRETAREIYDNMNENKQKYQDYLEDNEDLELEIKEIHNTNSSLKQSILKQTSENDNLQSEVLSAQKTLNTLGNRLANERTKRRHMLNEQDKMKTQIQIKEKEIEKLKEDLSNIKNKSMTTEERLNELNAIYENQKVIANQFATEKNKVMNLTYNVKTEIKEFQSKIDLLKNQLQQCNTKKIALYIEENKSKQLIMNKKEVVYDLSFQLEMIRIKITEAEGIVNIEEMHQLQEKLQTLKEELSQTTDYQHQLEKQLKSTEAETRRITKKIEKNTIELQTIGNEVEELNIRNEGDEKQIQLLKEQIHRCHMEEMMVKLKVEQMKKLTHNECEKVYSLAQQRDELTLDINMRKTELAKVNDQINMEKKRLLEEKSLMKRKLDSVVQYIEQRRNKYQILMATMGTQEDGDDASADGDGSDESAFAISKYRIRLTQEKLELQATGDKLDERVQKLETEIRAMESTLHVLNASNNCYKSSLSSVNPASDEYKEKVELEETYEKLNSMWLQKKKVLEDMENEIRDLEHQYKIRNEELENVLHLRDIKDNELERALKEANDQMMKLSRANNRIQFDLKLIDKTCAPDKRGALELIKRDIVVRLTKRVNKCVLELLSEMSIRHIGVEPTVKQYLSEKDLELPIVSGLTLNRIKSSCDSSSKSSVTGSNGSVKSYLDEDRKSSYSVVNLEPTPRCYARKSDSSIMNK